MEKLTPGVFGPGTKFRETRKMFGKSATELFEVVAVRPPLRLELFVDGTQGTSKRGRFDYVYEFEPDRDGTRVSLTGAVSQVPWYAELLGRNRQCGVKIHRRLHELSGVAAPDVNTNQRASAGHGNRDRGRRFRRRA
jgi:hypothetical protein